MLPALVHINKIKSTITSSDETEGSTKSIGPNVLILTPHQRTKEDIYAITKAYIDAANFKCACVYENEDKNEQTEHLSKSIVASKKKCLFQNKKNQEFQNSYIR